MSIAPIGITVHLSGISAMTCGGSAIHFSEDRLRAVSRGRSCVRCGVTAAPSGTSRRHAGIVLLRYNRHISIVIKMMYILTPAV